MLKKIILLLFFNQCIYAGLPVYNAGTSGLDGVSQGGVITMTLAAASGVPLPLAMSASIDDSNFTITGGTCTTGDGSTTNPVIPEAGSCTLEITANINTPPGRSSSLLWLAYNGRGDHDSGFDQSINLNALVYAVGELKCWGKNDSGQLGLGDTNNRGNSSGEMGDNLPFINLGTSQTVRQVSEGGAWTCAIYGDNTCVKCWGANTYGQLGQGNTTTVGNTSSDEVAKLACINFSDTTTYKALQIASGDNDSASACALLEATNGDRCVKCWGKNEFGQLGYGDTTTRGDSANQMGDNLPCVSLGSDFRPAELAVDQGFACARSVAGEVKCWGQNERGQLGIGSTENIGDEPNEMGDNLQSVDLGTGKTATRITAGINFVCAVLNDKTVKCWGGGARGQLGQGSTANIGNQSGEMGDNLPAVDLGDGFLVQNVVAGQFEVCAVSTNQEIKCWGDNSDGELGLGDTENRGDEPNEMGDNLPAVDLGTDLDPFDLLGGEKFYCALLTGGCVKCWGEGGAGRLGRSDGSTASIGNAPNEMGDNLTCIELGTNYTPVRLAESVGDDAGHACAILKAS